MVENTKRISDLSKAGSKIFTEKEKKSLFKSAIEIVMEAGKITNGYFKN